MNAVYKRIILKLRCYSSTCSPPPAAVLEHTPVKTFQKCFQWDLTWCISDRATFLRLPQHFSKQNHASDAVFFYYYSHSEIPTVFFFLTEDSMRRFYSMRVSVHKVLTRVYTLSKAKNQLLHLLSSTFWLIAEPQKEAVHFHRQILSWKDKIRSTSNGTPAKNQYMTGI